MKVEKKRQTVLGKLSVFLQNPGRFTVLVAGDRGTGKRFAIEQTFDAFDKQNADVNCLSQLKFVEAIDLPLDKTKMNALLESSHQGLLVVEDVEQLQPDQQRLLFEAMSTTNGLFGIDQKKYAIRMVFTSSADLDLLRDEDYYLSGRLWDRISQLIVRLPSYSDDEGEVVNDFEATWNKMKFETIESYKGLSGCPKNANWERFLQDNATKFTGGFRDLDKLVCMYFNYRILLYGDKRKVIEETDKKVIEAVKEDFFTQYQLQENIGNTLSEFKIQRGASWSQIQSNLKDQMRRWGKKEYGTIKATETELGLKHGTMKNWRKKMD